ncbi:glycoside hydrolase [Panus rudis PR-1116 ss-1]|nr:glycoside hydrolase [Panus rudis PR-1116 ss-1]
MSGFIADRGHRDQVFIVEHNLSTGWSWKEKVTQGDVTSAHVLNDSGWTLAATFPSEIYIELLHAGKIPDPFLGFNEHKVQWVADREWLYRCILPYNDPIEKDVEGPSRFVKIIFEGLDTFCDVYLNGKLILQSDNMFRTYAIDVQQNDLKPTDNNLLLHFHCANTGPISLTTYTIRLNDVHVHTEVTPISGSNSTLTIDVALEGNCAIAQSIQCTILDSTGRIIRDTESAIDPSVCAGNNVVLRGIASFVLKTDSDIKLWWPAGYGDQIMYDVNIKLWGKGRQILDEVSRRTGFRRIELIQEELEESDRYGKGNTFLFDVNGVRMFMGGSNWIPTDSFLTMITPERYRAWLTLLKEGNQNMVRLWGGGVYEPEIFYDICDELGILVWQDFQFACGVYPAHESFLENVRKEAEDTIKRLGRHPCMAIFCGNNEDYQQVLQWGDVEDLPARKIYEDVLPNAVSQFSSTTPPTPYHRGSPYGGKGWDTADPTVGDIHQWDVWAGKERPWQDYWKMGGRFVSEFGVPAMPDIRTIDYWLAGNTADRWPQSRSMAQHCRAGSHERRFAIVLGESFRWTGDLEQHMYNTQMMQSEALSLAYRSWRREWRGPGRQFCGGVLVWQLNDCWPVTSWSLIDYFLRPKPAYYSVSRELRPITIGTFRTVTKNRENDRPVQFYEFGAFQSIRANIDIWATNSTLEEHKLTLEVQYLDLQSDWKQNFRQEVHLLPNQTTELLTATIPEPPRSAGGTFSTYTHDVVVAVRLLDISAEEVIARYTDWPQPYRHVDFPDPELDVAVSGDQVTVNVRKPVKGLVLSVAESSNDADEVKWSDNALDVVPGDTQVVHARELKGRALTWVYLGHSQVSVT